MYNVIQTRFILNSRKISLVSDISIIIYREFQVNVVSLNATI